MTGPGVPDPGAPASVPAPEEPRVDLASVAGDAQAEDLLRQAAAFHKTPLYVADPSGRVVASFGPPGWAGKGPESIPVDVEEAAARGFAQRRIVVYDGVCGFVAAAKGGPGGEAARFAADLVAAFATRQYEAESLSKSLLDVFEEVNLFYGITSSLHRVGSTEGICATILARACEIVRVARASILLADPHTGVLRIVASHGMSQEQAAAVRVKPGGGSRSSWTRPRIRGRRGSRPRIATRAAPSSPSPSASSTPTS